ncbi:DUF5329 family protein [Adhaeribacter sp. BT258]|uniref:DUF5329 family protein n=1 Tax=Adhaeribacter terrigena TaxID=2793070 RepID=A0ABS1BYA0_9BACT|nr:DUF5329 family protein [Adhaeribacter terrigena]MBK0402075.1 DUF5329 family protein [Adhaeribacter terrigena]
MKKLIVFIMLVSGTFQASFPQNSSCRNITAVSQVVIMTEEEKVNHLIDYIRHLSGSVFIRNGKEYSPEKAADHLLSKWKKHKKKVKTAQGFVERLATYSKTDEPYMIRFSDGHMEKCGDLLSLELQRIEI